ncbi:DNA polymerase [Enterocloster clostridioformis]|uniref:DNA polymerase n=1 Tax=Enterocloster clostridioformis TaxID=1531 RepID=UPI0022E0DEFC|nr:DNA polymerase [Enterocloster clostridioformis]
MGRVLEMDVETYSDVDLIKCGAYAYADSPAFEVLLFAYSFDGEETQIIDLAQGETIPEEVEASIFDDSVTKTAFNANFERTCLSKYFGTQLSPDSWHCSAVQAAMLALPRSLEDVGTVLGLDKQKMKEGKELIRYFCVPCKPTKANGGRTRNLPHHAPEKWELFKTYCKRDVDVEKAIRQKLHHFPIPESEMEMYRLDQEINDRGVLVDLALVHQAISCERLHKEIVTKRAYELTGLENPNSVVQIKGWLVQNGVEAESLSKKAVAEMIEESDGEVEELLRLRLLMAKTSVKKYEAMERSVCKDGRVHGLLQFYGANRTGRWAGRLVQVQNLPQNHIVDLELARNLVKQGRFEDLELFYDSTPNVLSELIRTAFIPKQGCRFLVADFSAIEARVLAWLSGEQWRLDVFASHGKIYEASASAMFHVPIGEITKGSPLRQKGKISELALGYGGSVGALTSMGALDMGLTEEELSPLVSTWRNANPHITQFWWDVDVAAVRAVTEKRRTKAGRIIFEYKSGILFVILPSGRKLSYVKPRMAVNKFGRDGLTYEGISENKKWSRIETYGPKLVENIVQGTARDLLAEAMLRVEKAGYRIVMHCHDEIIAEVPEGFGSVEDMGEVMAVQPEWADGLPLRADGYECGFYQKQ